MVCLATCLPVSLSLLCVSPIRRSVARRKLDDGCIPSVWIRRFPAFARETISEWCKYCFQVAVAGLGTSTRGFNKRYSRKQCTLLIAELFSLVSSVLITNYAAFGAFEDNPHCETTCWGYWFAFLLVFLLGALSNCKSYLAIPVL